MSSQMNMHLHKLEPEDDTPRNLYDIVDQFLRKEILKPPHQRDKVWDEDKKRNWIKRLQGNLRPVGVVLTYQLIGEKPIWLNDGFQRVSTSAEYLANPELWGDTKEAAINNLRAVNMPRQHRHYKDHSQALIDFQQVNMGTSLSTYEFCRGILTYIENFHLYEEAFNTIIDCIEKSGKGIVNTRSRSRTVIHKHYRSSYGIFYRYLTRDKKTSAYSDISATQIKQDIVEQKKNIEWRLRYQIEKKISPSDFDKVVRKFTSFVERETALIEKIWYSDLEKPIGEGVSPTLYRWLLDVAVWKTNNDIPSHLHENFIKTLLTYTQGTSYVAVFDEEGKPAYNISLGLSNMGKLKGVCHQLKTEDFLNYPSSKKRSSSKRTKPGYDNSHTKPFSFYGDGQTFPEPASLNRARGAKDVFTGKFRNC